MGKNPIGERPGVDAELDPVRAEAKRGQKGQPKKNGEETSRIHGEAAEKEPTLIP